MFAKDATIGKYRNKDIFRDNDNYHIVFIHICDPLRIMILLII